VSAVAVCANCLSCTWSTGEIVELPTLNLTVAWPFTSVVEAVFYNDNCHFYQYGQQKLLDDRVANCSVLAQPEMEKRRSPFV